MNLSFHVLSEVSFRTIARNYVYVRCPKIVDELREGYKVEADDDGFMALCYVDHEKGISFLVIGAANFKGYELSVHGTKKKDSAIVLQIENLIDAQIAVLYPQNEQQKQMHSQIADILEEFEKDIPEVLETRDIDILDKFRNPFYPDDVEIHFAGEKVDPENMWVRLTRVGEDCLYGTLLDDPFQKIGIHKGDEISFILVKMEDGNIEAFHFLNDY